MTIDDGGAAFPRAGDSYSSCQNGMSLRDWLACQAAPLILKQLWENLRSDQQRVDNVYNIAAASSYELADAMLRERAKR